MSIKFIHILKFGVLLLVSFFIITTVFADWQQPNNPPPTCNAGDPGCDPPVNVSRTSQVKEGGLGVFGNFLVGIKDFFVDRSTGRVGIGLTGPTQALDVQGYVKGRSGLCIGDDCRDVWPEGGDGGGGGGVSSVRFSTANQDIFSASPTTGDVYLRMNSCANNQIIKYLNARWQCASDETGGGGGSGDITAVLTPANSGLKGGAESGAVTLGLDVNNLTQGGTPSGTDQIAVYNSSLGHLKYSINSIVDAGGGGGGGGGVTSVTASGGLTASPNPITGAGTVSIADSGVTRSKIASNSVVTSHLDNNSVTSQKLGLTYLEYLQTNSGAQQTYPVGSAMFCFLKTVNESSGVLKPACDLNGTPQNINSTWTILVQNASCAVICVKE